MISSGGGNPQDSQRAPQDQATDLNRHLEVVVPVGDVAGLAEEHLHLSAGKIRRAGVCEVEAAEAEAGGRQEPLHQGLLDPRRRAAVGAVAAHAVQRGCSGTVLDLDAAQGRGCHAGGQAVVARRPRGLQPAATAAAAGLVADPEENLLRGRSVEEGGDVEAAEGAADELCRARPLTFARGAVDAKGALAEDVAHELRGLERRHPRFEAALCLVDGRGVRVNEFQAAAALNMWAVFSCDPRLFFWCHSYTESVVLGLRRTYYRLCSSAYLPTAVE